MTPTEEVISVQFVPSKLYINFSPAPSPVESVALMVSPSLSLVLKSPAAPVSSVMLSIVTIVVGAFVSV